MIDICSSLRGRGGRREKFEYNIFELTIDIVIDTETKFKLRASSTRLIDKEICIKRHRSSDKMEIR